MLGPKGTILSFSLTFTDHDNFFLFSAENVTSWGEPCIGIEKEQVKIEVMLRPQANAE